MIVNDWGLYSMRRRIQELHLGTAKSSAVPLPRNLFNFHAEMAHLGVFWL